MTRLARRAKPLDEADVLGFSAARQICMNHAKTLYFASFFLPKGKRNAAHAVVAFCRMIRQAFEQADVGEGSSSCARTDLDHRLAMLMERLDQIYAGQLELPRPEFRSPEQHVLHAATRAIGRYDIPKDYFAQFARGCSADQRVKRYATWNSLERHCRAVGDTVGLILGAVLGLTSSGAAAQAAELGRAVRFTQILSDVPIDWQRGHLYLPLEDMVRFGYGERELDAGIVDAPFSSLMRFEITRAREMFRRGAEGVAWVANDGSRLTAAVLAVLYAEVLKSIERCQCDVFSGRVELTAGQRFRGLPLAWRLARRRADQPMPAGLF